MHNPFGRWFWVFFFFFIFCSDAAQLCHVRKMCARDKEHSDWFKVVANKKEEWAGRTMLLVGWRPVIRRLYATSLHCMRYGACCRRAFNWNELFIFRDDCVCDSGPAVQWVWRAWTHVEWDISTKLKFPMCSFVVITPQIELDSLKECHSLSIDEENLRN